MSAFFLHLPILNIQFVTWLSWKFSLKEDEKVAGNTKAIFFSSILQFEF